MKIEKIRAKQARIAAAKCNKPAAVVERELRMATAPKMAHAAIKVPKINDFDELKALLIPRIVRAAKHTPVQLYAALRAAGYDCRGYGDDLGRIKLAADRVLETIYRGIIDGNANAIEVYCKIQGIDFVDSVFGARRLYEWDKALSQ